MAQIEASRADCLDFWNLLNHDVLYMSMSCLISQILILIARELVKVVRDLIFLGVHVARESFLGVAHQKRAPT